MRLEGTKDMGNPAETPVAPEQSNGWVVLGVFRDINLMWKVTARKGGNVLIVGKLTQDEVRTFDATVEIRKVR